MVGEIGLIGLGLAALGADFRNDGGRLVGGIPVIDRDRSAFGRKGECDLPADVPGAAGDERHAILQLHVHGCALLASVSR